eukprot:3080566-Prymnesium_polylepis.1
MDALIIEQHVKLRSRLQMFAKEPTFATAWEAELRGEGHGTTIMRSLFTEPSLYVLSETRL